MNGSVSNWTLLNETLAASNSNQFAVYDEVTQMVYGIGGSNNQYEVWHFNASSNLITFYGSIDVDENGMEHFTNFYSSNCNAAELLNNTKMYVLDGPGNLWVYDIFSNKLHFVNNDITSNIGQACLVSNKDDHDYFDFNSTFLYTCNGWGANLVACYKYSLSNDSWTQLPSINQHQYQQSCLYFLYVEYK